MSGPAPPGRTGAARADGGKHAVIAALQAALAAENAAVFGYGVAGAHLSGHQQARARRDWAIHESARDTLTAMVTARGAVPVAAAAAYRLPFAVHNAATATALAAYLEERLTTAYLGLVALPARTLRAFGARGVQAAALRAAGWRGSTVAFPGMTTPARGRAPGHRTPTASPASS